MRETALKYIVADRFTALVKARGIISLERFAEEVGVGSATLYRMQRGEIDIRLSTLEKIAQALQCSPADLLTDTTPTPSPAMAGGGWWTCPPFPPLFDDGG